MAVSLTNALAELADTKAKSKKLFQKARAKALAEKETTEERLDYLWNTTLRFGAAAAAGFADAKIDDTLGPFTPSELGGFAAGALSLSGMLGRATKGARSLAEGALCGSIYRRAFVAGGGGAGSPAMQPSGDEGDAEVSGRAGATDEHDILVALRQEQSRGLRDAEEFVD